MPGPLVRYYFHVTDGEERIRDEDGIEVSDVEAMEAAALETIKEMRQEDPFASDEWRGWWLEVIDASGRLVKRIPLDISFNQ